MIDHIFNIFGGKKNTRNPENSGELVDFIPSFEDIDDIKKEHNLNRPARTVSRLIKYLESHPNQKWRREILRKAPVPRKMQDRLFGQDEGFKEY